jgi:outer membrane protein assembly factor BamB
MPTSFIWNDRIRPDINWWCIALYIILVAVTIIVCYWRLVRGRLAKRFPLQELFFITALSLGIAFFIRIGVIEKPKEFTRAVICLNRNTGEIVWTCEGLTGQKRGRIRTVTYASATPATDGERIYGYFGEDGLICVDLDGEILWKKTEPLFESQFSLGTSPVVQDNILIIVSDVRESENFLSSITAFDCVSGKRLWKKERKSHNDYAAYNTPLIKTLNGRQIVIVHGWYDIKGYDLQTGQELWCYPMNHGGRHLVASLSFDTERIYVVGVKQIRALDLSKLGTGSDPLVWSKSIAGEKSSTPVVANELMFLVTENGTAFCLEAQTGEILWKERLKGRYFSSVVTIGNKVLFTNTSGQTTIAAVDAEFRQLTKNTLNESVYASFAPVGNQLFARTSKYLYCIQEDER